MATQPSYASLLGDSTVLMRQLEAHVLATDRFCLAAMFQKLHDSASTFIQPCRPTHTSSVTATCSQHEDAIICYAQSHLGFCMLA